MHWVFHTFCIFLFYKANNDVKEQPVSVDLNVSSARAWLKLISVYLKSKKQFAFSPAVVDQQTGKQYFKSNRDLRRER